MENFLISGHISDALKRLPLPEGVSDQIFQQSLKDPMSYKAGLNPKNEKHCQLLSGLLQHRIVNLKNCTIRQLAPFKLGFDTPEAEKILEELKETRERQGVSHEAWQHGEQSLVAVTERQNQNSDPEKVAGFRKELAKLTEKIGFDRTMSETLERKAEELHGQLFQSVKDHRDKQIRDKRAKLQPEIHRFNQGIRQLYREWNLIGAPLLQQISDLDGASPGKLFFGSLPLVMDSAVGSPYAINPDLALTKLKRLEIHPVIRNGHSGRCDFGLEEWRKK